MKTYKYIAYILILILISGCDGDNGTEPTDYTAGELTEQGWSRFETADYQKALEMFEEEINKDNSYVEAYNGAGWANARLTNLSEAVSYFSQCIALSSSHVDAYAGLAFVYNAQKNYQSAINSANNALNKNSNWNFTHDETLNYKDLHLLLAECYFAVLDFSNSLAQVQILNPSFTAEVTTYEGRSALAAEIERLRGIV